MKITLENNFIVRLTLIFFKTANESNILQTIKFFKCDLERIFETTLSLLFPLLVRLALIFFETAA